MTTTIIGFPRLGEFRELKFETEKYFRNEISADDLKAFAKELRQKHWNVIKDAGIDQIPSNDFSFYDNTLDTSVLFNIIPKKVKDLDFDELEEYFALARGYQGEKGDVHALPMKKWFNTNYHYLVPQFEKTTNIQVNTTKIVDEFLEAKELGILTRPVILGPFTLLQLGQYHDGTSSADFATDLLAAYQEVFTKLAAAGAEWIQIDEPGLVLDLTAEDIARFKEFYQTLLANKNGLNVLLQTYFGDIRDIYEEVIALDFDGIGLDFVEGKETLNLITNTPFPEDKKLFAGIVNGKNIWTNNYTSTFDLLAKLPKNVVLSTSCSLLHVPYSVENEVFSDEIKQYFAFAKEKLAELVALDKTDQAAIEKNNRIFKQERITANKALQEKIAQLTDADFVRLPAFDEREALQTDLLKLPNLPTTTIGSFPQTKEVKITRGKFKRGEITQEEYDAFIAKKIDDCIAFQEKIGLDVLVHGEFERNDMVEFFGEALDGYLFSKNGWVQSYGTRGVKPPIIWGDIARSKAITVQWSKYAQSKTEQIVKGMLTGPVTILNWSFPREDISIKDSTYQLALAIQEEVLDLEANGIRIIQIDEAALREKLPLRQTDWYSEYLDWAIPAFRLVHSKVQPETQIHTHMCYSEFEDIIQAIDDMDADVISFEASRSNLALLDALNRNNFQTQVGPGVYDIHSPRIPSVEEIKQTIGKILEKIPTDKVWVNPDCGLKTRGEKETYASLENLVLAAKEVREGLVND
ncbi:5-methyltetrahydropteroyltriglutamate--homocysteine S-methyltransferase [Enterococcus saccharolyticus]|uniref:5-methyltetrahydropteroyltriglutamate--homocysteine methyltransferase n=1 Tax=Enterococcus saccharolyticus subsp. saccharolyticus ATCC 43076 TaxID=1139996 RepID=S0NUC3_9ENTE|nr:5-methyltetrahydropteroyltriglutamate--homocysteine S-methyltransferase [Enterococcus saccharolyticus]EOT28509.1 5-methyltetrahydropteroyltriglutamate-homocysteine S-methyltransferase [Enterococcus saccharolyticus subsp. saccharolyticus ATCC 43076]EOT81500.1 5-methyltetrahydropteroyltriglutamate-homocysteine S-methyltransferase [Enterococcus saccharolyticus subsp. saccharolyticus ATCC 43076]OJG87191.1 5-methyltetrahydropteroyltriglutamate-homocysteine S-methyltransferase [Enterococcus sacchar